MTFVVYSCILQCVLVRFLLHHLQWNQPSKGMLRPYFQTIRCWDYVRFSILLKRKAQFTTMPVMGKISLTSARSWTLGGKEKLVGVALQQRRSHTLQLDSCSTDVNGLYRMQFHGLKTFDSKKIFSLPADIVSLLLLRTFHCRYTKISRVYRSCTKILQCHTIVL